MKMKFCINNRWLKDFYTIEIEWNLDLIPRVGESIHSGLIVWQKSFSKDDFINRLTDEGKEDLDESDLGFEQWAINVLAESNLVEAIMYSPCRENNLDICVVIHLAE